MDLSNPKKMKMSEIATKNEENLMDNVDSLSNDTNSNEIESKSLENSAITEMKHPEVENEISKTSNKEIKPSEDKKRVDNEITPISNHSKPEKVSKNPQNHQNSSQTIQESSQDKSETPPHCQFWVKRKNRYCKMTLKEGRKFCGEHLLEEPKPELNEKRVLCPLDPSHSVYAFRLAKHLTICNVKKLDVDEVYKKKNLNIGDPKDGDDEENFRLRDVPADDLNAVIKIVEKLFDEHVEGKIKTEIKSHKVLTDETQKESHSFEKLRHLLQTSSILGILESKNFFKSQTCFIDLGAGKGNLSFWLAMAIEHEKMKDSKVFVIDRASHRYKKDNLIRELGIIERIRVDIGDLDVKELNFQKSKSLVGVSKHLCGCATDFALRCLLNGNEGEVKTEGFLICVCCHHQITYNSFIGRDWLTSNGIDRKTFNIIIKMVSWCTCGDGRNREFHKEHGLENEEKVKERELIGWKCKRLLDYARVKFMCENGYDTNLSFYVDKSHTLENVCIVGRRTNDEN